jgi:hypothetical protein
LGERFFARISTKVELHFRHNMASAEAYAPHKKTPDVQLDGSAASAHITAEAVTAEAANDRLLYS